jgi:hypothetical protein
MGKADSCDLHEVNACFSSSLQRRFIPAFDLAAMKHPLLAALLATPFLAAADPLEDAEVRLPYSEIRRLLDERKEPAPAEVLPSSLASARFKVSREGGRIVIAAAFRTVRFSDRPTLVPLLGGTVALERSEPAELGLLVEDGQICHASAEPGSSAFTARFLGAAEEVELTLPASPSLIFETAEPGFIVVTGDREQPLLPDQPLALPVAGTVITLRALSTREAEESLRPPEPSDWIWQHQALLRDAEGELEQFVIARASATSGSGLSAELLLPADARDVQATGEDLVSSRGTRDAEGSIRLLLEWKSRDLLEREVTLTYRRPLRPLDTTWQLAAPRGSGEQPSRTRFLIAANPRRAFEAAGLAGPFDPDGLPPKLREMLGGSAYHTLESKDHAAELGARELPLVATAEAVISEATWALRQETDGALLAEGLLKIEHRQPLRVAFDSPAGFILLSCAVNGRDTRPIDRGAGRIEIPLPPAGKEASSLQLTFTAAGEALDPVSGTLSLALPRTPLFIRSLNWRIDLPAAYRAEVHGNLIRDSLAPADPLSAIRLRKNLCRDEVPAVSVFYQRADLSSATRP